MGTRGYSGGSMTLISQPAGSSPGAVGCRFDQGPLEMEREGEQSHVQHCGLSLGVEFCPLPTELARPNEGNIGMTDHFDVPTRTGPGQYIQG